MDSKLVEVVGVLGGAVAIIGGAAALLRVLYRLIAGGPYNVLKPLGWAIFVVICLVMLVISTLLVTKLLA